MTSGIVSPMEERRKVKERIELKYKEIQRKIRVQVKKAREEWLIDQLMVNMKKTGQFQ